MTGKRFARLTVLKLLPKRARHRHWLCRCDCGEEIEVIGSNLRRGNTHSCGCWNREQRSRVHYKHGKSNARVHWIWATMIQRATNPNNHEFDRYGGRGIGVCDRWKTFGNFLADMGEPQPKQQIERIDNSKGYEPGNCKWASILEQARNKRNNKFVTYDGETLCVAEWAHRKGLKVPTLWLRLFRRGWPVEEALHRPVSAVANREVRRLSEGRSPII